MSNYTRSYATNLTMVVLLLAISSTQLILNFAALSFADFVALPDFTLYAFWVFVWVMTAGVGIEVVKDAWEHDKEEWLESVIPPLFPEGVI